MQGDLSPEVRLDDRRHCVAVGPLSGEDEVDACCTRLGPEALDAGEDAGRAFASTPPGTISTAPAAPMPLTLYERSKPPCTRMTLVDGQAVLRLLEREH